MADPPPLPLAEEELPDGAGVNSGDRLEGLGVGEDSRVVKESGMGEDSGGELGIDSIATIVPGEAVVLDASEGFGAKEALLDATLPSHENCCVRLTPAAAQSWPINSIVAVVGKIRVKCWMEQLVRKRHSERLRGRDGIWVR